MIFGTDAMCRNVNLKEIKYGENSISRVYKAKYLGMILGPSLNFKKHVENIKSKTIGKINLLGRVGPFISKTTAWNLYCTIILPIFDYRDILYDCLVGPDAQTLQVLQNMAVKFVLGVPHLTSTWYGQSPYAQIKTESYTNV